MKYTKPIVSLLSFSVLSVSMIAVVNADDNIKPVNEAFSNNKSKSSLKNSSKASTKSDLYFYDNNSSGEKPPEGGGSEKPPEGGGSEKPPEGGGSEKPPEGGGSEKPPEGGGSEKPPEGGGSEKPPEGGGSEKPPEGGGSEKPPEGGGSEKPPEGGGSEKPPEGGGSEKPVDPNHPSVIPPDKPGSKPSHPDGGGSVGDGFENFHIKWASDLNFGGIERKKSDMLKYAEPFIFNTSDNVELAPFIQINDTRDVSSGWDLSVSMTPFSNEYDQLKGVTLTFSDVTLIASSNQKDILTPKISSNRVLSTDGSSYVLSTAEKETGTGVWTFSFTNDSNGFYSLDKGVYITIPSSTNPKLDTTYQSTMTWILASTP